MWSMPTPSSAAAPRYRSISCDLVMGCCTRAFAQGLASGHALGLGLELREVPAGCAQRGGRPLLEDAPVAEHDDAVRPLDGAQPVSDDQRGAPGQKPAEAALDAGLGGGIDARGGL